MHRQMLHVLVLVPMQKDNLVSKSSQNMGQYMWVFVLLMHINLRILFCKIDNIFTTDCLQYIGNTCNHVWIEPMAVRYLTCSNKLSFDIYSSENMCNIYTNFTMLWFAAFPSQSYKHRIWITQGTLGWYRPHSSSTRVLHILHFARDAQRAKFENTFQNESLVYY